MSPTFNRQLLLLQLSGAETALSRAASTDALKRAMLAARVRRIWMRLGLAVPSGDLRDGQSEPASIGRGPRKYPQ